MGVGLAMLAAKAKALELACHGPPPLQLRPVLAHCSQGPLPVPANRGPKLNDKFIVLVQVKLRGSGLLEKIWLRCPCEQASAVTHEGPSL